MAAPAPSSQAPPPAVPAANAASAGLSERERAFTVGAQYLVARGDGAPRPATVLNSRYKLGVREAYISFVGEDKRLDQWVPGAALGEEIPAAGPSRTNGQTALIPGSPADSAPSSPEREHAQVTRVRNFEDVRFGEYLVKTWYYSPYPMPLDTGTPIPQSKGKGKKRKEPGDGASTPRTPLVSARSANDVMAVGVGKDGEGARGRLWVCDLCFKYMRTRAGWENHTATCNQMRPPGRKVYQRGSYTIWEVDGATATLYCQNLSLFGKLFIDHKSVFFHVENFLFYVLCDAATSTRDQVMAFFSKEKVSYDDFNLACIVTFPPHQNRGFGKLLIEFSYYLTRHPATRPSNLSPGTPERPLSDLGRKGYMAYWVSVVIRLCRRLLAGAPASAPPTPKAPAAEGRSLRTRKAATPSLPDETITINGAELIKRPDPTTPGHFSVAAPLGVLARACHLRTDDLQMVLEELGFLRHRRAVPRRETDEDEGEEPGEWTDVEIVVTHDEVEDAAAKWRVKDKPLLEEKYCLL